MGATETPFPKIYRKHQRQSSACRLAKCGRRHLLPFANWCQWNAIPKESAPGSTAHQYFQELLEAGVFDCLWQEALIDYDDLAGLDLPWQCVDGAMIKAPLGGQKTGKNPTDRAKQGTKRSFMTDANGIPLGLAVAGANVHDIHMLE